MAAGEKLAHQPQNDEATGHDQCIFPVCVSWEIVDERKAAALIDEVEQRIPVKHGQHEAGQTVRDKHFARCDHIRTLIYGCDDIRGRRKPGF